MKETMSYFLRVLSALAVLALGISPSMMADVYEPTRVVVFGDSIAAGRYLDNPSDAWPALLAKRGVTVENRGVGGSILHNASPSIPNRLMINDAITAAINEWNGNAPKYAIMAGGANDIVEHQTASYPSDLTSEEHPRWELVYMSQRLRAAGVQTILYVTLVPRSEGTITDAYPTWPGILQARTASFNAWLRAGFPGSVIDTRGHFGDLRSGLGNTAFYIGDGLHPNALGQRVIADRVAAALTARGLL